MLVICNIAGNKYLTKDIDNAYKFLFIFIEPFYSYLLLVLGCSQPICSVVTRHIAEAQMIGRDGSISVLIVLKIEYSYFITMSIFD